EAVPSEMANRIAAIMATRGVHAWFWGHEHKCMTFKSRPGLRYAACVGHGAMPEPTGHAHPEPGEWEYDVGRPDGDGDHGRMCGFAVLDFNHDSAEVRYVNQKGETHAKEPLE